MSTQILSFWGETFPYPLSPHCSHPRNIMWKKNEYDVTRGNSVNLPNSHQKSNMRNYCVCRSQNVFFIREKNIGTFSFNQYFASGTKILVFNIFSKRADTLNIFPDNSE